MLGHIKSQMEGIWFLLLFSHWKFVKDLLYAVEWLDVGKEPKHCGWPQDFWMSVDDL